MVGMYTQVYASQVPFVGVSHSVYTRWSVLYTLLVPVVHTAGLTDVHFWQGG